MVLLKLKNHEQGVVCFQIFNFYAVVSSFYT